MSIRLLITVVAFSWILSTAAMADPIPLPLGMSVHGETTANDHAEYLFEADGPGMLSVAIRSDNGEDVAFSVRTASGAALVGGEFDVDFNGNVGAEQGIIALPEEGEYIVSVRPLGGNASFVMGVSWLPFEEAAGGVNGIIPEPIDPTEDAEPILLGEQFEDSIDATEGERERWYSYEADVDGVFLIIVHDATADMIIEGYNEGQFANPFAHSDEDFGGHGGNEIILKPVVEGEVYYFKVAPLSQGNSAEFHVISEIFPGAQAAGAGGGGVPRVQGVFGFGAEGEVQGRIIELERAVQAQIEIFGENRPEEARSVPSEVPMPPTTVPPSLPRE